MATYGWTVNGSSTGFSLNTSDGTRPVYFAKASDPVMTINCKAIYGPTSCQGINNINTNGAHIHVPAGAKPTANWDGHMTIVETDTGDEYDLWHATISGSTITADTGAEMNVNTSDGTGDGGDAASLALTGGLLRPSELASGHINHALVITVPCTNANGANVGYSWPASGGWGETCGDYWTETTTSAPTIGALFKLNMTDNQIANSGAPAWQQTIMTALAHYGAYAEDTNGSWHNKTMGIIMQDPASFTNIGQTNQWATTLTALGGQSDSISSSVPIPASRLQVVDPCVVQGTCPDASTNDPQPPGDHDDRGDHADAEHHRHDDGDAARHDGQVTKTTPAPVTTTTAARPAPRPAGHDHHPPRRRAATTTTATRHHDNQRPRPRVKARTAAEATNRPRSTGRRASGRQRPAKAAPATRAKHKRHRATARRTRHVGGHR